VVFNEMGRAQTVFRRFQLRADLGQGVMQVVLRSVVTNAIVNSFTADHDRQAVRGGAK
jgi:hypothetical protein